MDISFNNTTLRNLGHLNVILGKNGVGKSELLRAFDSFLVQNPTQYFVKYISPERGGDLAYHASVEQNLRGDERWSANNRRKNRVAEFKHMSFSEYKNLELLVLRKKEADPTAPSFDDTLAHINELLDHVKLVRGSRPDFEVRNKHSNQEQTAYTLSSGEAELLSLAIEVLAFCHVADHSDHAGKQKILLIDGPDVHLHPDLQVRFIKLIAEATRGKDITTIIATHSTPILAALNPDTDRVVFMARGTQTLQFRPLSEQIRRIVPVFGAHALTNIFNESPILLLEGEDDELIWQKAVRAAQGALKLYPRSVGTVDQLNNHEREAAEILQAVYDNARGYSLRDGDGIDEEIEDVGCIVRMRLRCHAAENLMLTDDVLHFAGTNWESLLQQLRQFIAQKEAHPKHKELRAFVDAGAPRRMADLKEIRLLLAGFFTNKPWEVIVGQAIARLAEGKGLEGSDSLSEYLGAKVCSNLLGLPRSN